MDYRKLINTNIKALRIKHGMTQEVFSEKIGMSLQGLSNIERNRYQPTADTVDRICKVFNITPAQLLLINNRTNETLINNITTLLAGCSTQKLNKIYEIVKIIIDWYFLTRSLTTFQFYNNLPLWTICIYDVIIFLSRWLAKVKRLKTVTL